MQLHSSIQPFFDDVEAFCARNGLSATRFGKLALNDERFLHDLRRRGRNPSPFTIDRVRAFMREREGVAA